YGLSHSEQNIAANLLGQTALAFVAILLVPTVVASFGWRALFLGLVLLLVPALLTVGYFPSGRSQAGRLSVSERVPLSVDVWMALSGVAIFFVGLGGLWTFLEEIGQSSGIPASVLHTCLSICTAFGFLRRARCSCLGRTLQAK